MKQSVSLFLVAMLAFASAALAAADLEINTPAIAALQSAMQTRHNKLAAYYASGAVGLTRDGNVALAKANMATKNKLTLCFISPLLCWVPAAWRAGRPVSIARLDR